MGARIVGEARFFSAPSRVQQELNLTTEMVALWQLDKKAPMGGIKDISGLLGAANKDRVLDAPEILEVADCIRGVWLLRGFIEANHEDAPLLSELASATREMDFFHDEIYVLFDDNGELAGSASEQLGSMRKSARSLHRRIRSKIEGMLADLAIREHLQDDYFTVRENRYVLPVRLGEKPFVAGIIHGSSQTGQTLFIEPESLVPLNNELKLCEHSIALEERRILAQSTRKIGSRHKEILVMLELAVTIDTICARARLAIEMEAKAPLLCAQGSVSLKQARNPILVLRGLNVVANDIALSDDWQVLILSGPNAGGKTVTMSTLGLFALMLRAGLLIPAHESSTMPIFGEVLMVKGDQQDLNADLSSFSGHLKRLQEVLAAMTEKSLVLIDEIVVGTEPDQGAALAIAVIERIADCGAVAVVTTHYKRLKTLSLSDTRFQNASVGIDPKSQRPNYQLSFGAPGASSPIELAAQMGLESGIVDRARELWGEKEQSLEAILNKLAQDQELLAEERLAVEHQRERLEREVQEYNERIQEIENNADELVQKARAEAFEELRHAKEALAEVVRELQKDRSPTTVHRRRNKVRVIEEELVSAGDGELSHPDAPPHLPRSEAVVGARCYLPAFSRDGVIVEIRGVNAVVQIGTMTSTLAIQSLRQPKDAAKKQRTEAVPVTVAPQGLPPKTSENTCDVRGHRLDEALDRVEQFLDNALLNDCPIIYVLHGHGTGRLKAGIRQSFDSSRYVRKHAPADRNRGGDGVTVVWLT
jgi:DNA mismatch repair protein MutS2